MDMNISKVIIDAGTNSNIINWGNILSSLIGGITGGLCTLTGVIISHKNNEKTEQGKEDRFENSVLQAISAELKILKNMYENEMDKVILGLDENNYLTNYYTAKQDFMTIYHGNTQNIGKIHNTDIRENIIKTYSNIKKFLESTEIYKDFS